MKIFLRIDFLVETLIGEIRPLVTDKKCLILGMKQSEWKLSEELHFLEKDTYNGCYAWIKTKSFSIEVQYYSVKNSYGSLTENIKPVVAKDYEIDYRTINLCKYILSNVRNMNILRPAEQKMITLWKTPVKNKKLVWASMKDVKTFVSEKSDLNTGLIIKKNRKNWSIPTIKMLKQQKIWTPFQSNVPL